MLVIRTRLLVSRCSFKSLKFVASQKMCSAGAARSARCFVSLWFHEPKFFDKLTIRQWLRIGLGLGLGFGILGINRSEDCLSGMPTLTQPTSCSNQTAWRCLKQFEAKVQTASWIWRAFLHECIADRHQRRFADGCDLVSRCTMPVP